MRQTNHHRGAPGGSNRLRRSRALLCAGALACAVTTVASGSAARGPALPAPGGLKTFAHHLGERSTQSSTGVPVYSRTPSFAWAPVRAATHYEFELSTSARFLAGNGLVWSSRTLATPATAIPLSLPWITGQPASLYWRVRAVGGNGVSAWSKAKPFTMRWTNLPTEWRPKRNTAANRPGYVRWHPVEGATAYQVWFVGIPKVITTVTNVADLREYYTLRDPAWAGVARWRVRAVRAVYGRSKNTLPAVSYGPWTPVYEWANAANPLLNGKDVEPVAAISNSDRASTPGRAALHNLMPVVLFKGNGNTSAGLHRVYVFSDSDCVNVVYRGAIVGGPAYAPRASGPLALPTGLADADDAREFLKDGEEGETFTLDMAAVTTTESASGNDGAAEAGASGGSSAKPGGSLTSRLAKVDLWDRDFPKGRYYVAVVPVELTDDDGRYQYQDTELAQDVCQGSRAARPRMLSFGKEGVGARPVSKATGLSPGGRLLSAASGVRQFYGPPLVTWEPAPAAVAYDVEWSRSSYPWRAAGSRRTPATSVMLPLTPGTWWYRVRGINESLPGNQKMSWSKHVRIQIKSPTFSVVGG